jgi:TonB family protein
MRGPLALILVAACGGAKPKPVEPAPVVVSARPTTRHIIDDSEPTEGVTVLNARGRMEPADIEAGLAPHTQALTDCYMTRVGKRRWLGGNVQIHWDISKDGDITAVKLIESDLGAWPIEKCLLEVARDAKFSPPKGGDADFMVPLTFSAKGGAQAWDEDAGLKAVGGQLAKLDACVQAKNKKVKTKTPPDDVTITVYVGPRGAAQSVGFASKASVLEETWADCAVKAAMAWRLPDPRGQVAKLAVRYRAGHGAASASDD